MYRLSPIMYIYRLGFLQSHPVTWGLRPIRLLNANSYPNKVDSRLVSGLLLRTPSTDPRYGTSRYRLKTINKDFTYGLSSRSPLSAKFRTLRCVNVIMSKSCFRRKEMPMPVDRESLNSRWFRKPLSQLFKIPSELFHSKTSIIRIFEAKLLDRVKIVMYAILECLSSTYRKSNWDHRARLVSSNRDQFAQYRYFQYFIIFHEHDVCRSPIYYYAAFQVLALLLLFSWSLMTSHFTFETACNIVYMTGVLGVLRCNYFSNL